MRISTRGPARRRSGFTLPEVIVTITLIGVLASVVVPTIISQVKKGDPARMGSDFMAVRGAVDQFLTDVRKYPKDIGQLTSVITTTQAPLASTSLANYGSAEVQRWRGPYLSKDGTAALVTGFGLTMANSFDVDTLAVSGAANSVGGQRYMVLSVPMKDSLAALDLDRQFDDGVFATGSIRYRMGTVDTLKFLVMPIS